MSEIRLHVEPDVARRILQPLRSFGELLKPDDYKAAPPYPIWLSMRWSNRLLTGLTVQSAKQLGALLEQLQGKLSDLNDGDAYEEVGRALGLLCDEARPLFASYDLARALVPIIDGQWMQDEFTQSTEWLLLTTQAAKLYAEVTFALHAEGLHSPPHADPIPGTPEHLWTDDLGDAQAILDALASCRARSGA